MGHMDAGQAGGAGGQGEADGHGLEWRQRAEDSSGLEGFEEAGLGQDEEKEEAKGAGWKGMERNGMERNGMQREQGTLID